MMLSFRRTAKLVVCGAAIALINNAAPRAQSDARAILAKYEGALEPLRCVEYKAHVATYNKNENEAEKLHQDMRYVWRCNGGFAKVSMEGKIWDVRSDSHKALYERKSILLLDPRGDRSNVDWRTEGAVSFLMDRKPSDSQRRQVFGVAPFTLLHGYLSLSGVPYVPDVLRDSRVTARAEALDQRNVLVLDGTGRNGRLQLWCDPATGFWPRRVEWRLAATDVLLDTNGDKPQEKTLARIGLQTILVVVDGWDFTRINESWVPTTFTELRTKTYTDNRVVASRSVCTISDISIAPRHLNDPTAFELGSEVPEGTRVTVSNERQIEYVWHDGSVVKRIGADLIPLEGQSVSPTGLPKSLITLCTIAAGMIVLLLLAWRWRTARR